MNDQERFSDLVYLDETLAFRAAYTALELTKLMSASVDTTRNQKENEIFALDTERTVRQHLAYIAFKLAREAFQDHKWVDQRTKGLIEALLKAFALK